MLRIMEPVTPAAYLPARPVAAYLEAHRDERDDAGHALIVRNGKGRTRKVTVGAGTIPVSAPRVNDRRTDEWESGCRAFQKRSLADRDYVYVWVDAVHFNVRLEDDRLCTLVMIGVRPDGTKALITVEDGYRESAESWRTVLRDLKRRGRRPPVVAVDDGAADGLQAPRHGAGALATARRRTPAAARPRRHRLRGWRPARREGQQAEGGLIFSDAARHLTSYAELTKPLTGRARGNQSEDDHDER